MNKKELLEKYPEIGEIIGDVCKLWIERDELWGVADAFEEYKKQFEPKKEWEILSFRKTKKSYIAGDIVPVSQELVATWLSCPDINEIYSVKRLSDGEIFTIGDKCIEGDINSSRYIWKIKEFKILNPPGYPNSMYTYHTTASNTTTVGLSINTISKVNSLFTTHDGVELYNETNALYRVLPKQDWHESICGVKWVLNNLPTDYLCFSTPEAREEYILQNKPLLSVSDILNSRITNHINVHILEGELKEIAKSKLLKTNS